MLRPTATFCKMAYDLKYSLLWKLRSAVFLRVKIQSPTHQCPNHSVSVWWVEEGGCSHSNSAAVEQTAEERAIVRTGLVVGVLREAC